MSDIRKETIGERIETIADGQCLFIAGPAFEQMMTGVIDIRVLKNGLVKMVYEDGTRQERPAGAEILRTPVDDVSMLDIVAFVQGDTEAEEAK